MEVEKETPIWYAMRATYRREPDAMRLLEKENWVVCSHAIQDQYKEKVRKCVFWFPVIHNLLFCSCLSF